MITTRMYPTDVKPYTKWNVEVRINQTLKTIEDLSFEQAQHMINIITSVDREAVKSTKSSVLNTVSDMINDFK